MAGHQVLRCRLPPHIERGAVLSTFLEQSLGPDTHRWEKHRLHHGNPIHLSIGFPTSAPGLVGERSPEPLLELTLASPCLTSLDSSAQNSPHRFHSSQWSGKERGQRRDLVVGSRPHSPEPSNLLHRSREANQWPSLSHLQVSRLRGGFQPIRQRNTHDGPALPLAKGEQHQL